MLTFLIFILLVDSVCAYKIAVGGTVKLDDKPAPDGIKITAQLEGKILAESTTKQGAYMLTIENAQELMYKQIDLFVENKITAQTMVTEDKYIEKNIKIISQKTTTSTQKAQPTTTTTIQETGIVGLITQYAPVNIATILGLLILLILFISIIRDLRD